MSRLTTAVSFILLLVLGEGFHSYYPYSFRNKWDDSKRTAVMRKFQVEATKSEEHRHADPVAFSENAHFYLRKHLDQNVTLQMEGYISRRQALGPSLVFLDLVQNDNQGPVQVIIRREVFVGEHFDAYFGILQPGVVVRLDGYSRRSRKSGTILLFVTDARFVRPNKNPQHLRKVLSLVHSRHLALDEVAQALQILPQTLVESLESVPEDARDNAEALYALSKKLLGPLCSLHDPSKLTGSSKGAKIKLLPEVPLQFTPPPEFFNDSGTRDTEDPQPIHEIFSNTANPHGEYHHIIGWVQNRLRLQQAVTVIEVVDDFGSASSSSLLDESTSHGSQQILCILHPSMTPGNLTIHGNLLCPGSQLSLYGMLDVRRNETYFWVTREPQLLHSSSRPSVVRYLLDLAYGGQVDLVAVSTALHIPLRRAREIVSIDNPTQRHWIASELARDLQNSTICKHQVTNEMLTALAKQLIYGQSFH